MSNVLATVTVSSAITTVILSIVLPLLTSLVSARFASGQAKNAVLLGLTVVAAAVQQVASNGGVVSLSEFLGMLVTLYLGAVAVHSKLLKPLGVTGTDGVIQRRFVKGLGQPRHVAG